MKEIWKVVQKLSREQDSAYEPVQNMKSHPVYQGDFISKLDIVGNFLLGNTFI